MNQKETRDEESNEQLYIADPNQSFIRLDKFLLDRVERVSRTKIQEGIKEGRVLVNGERIKASYRVRPFDRVSFFPNKPRNAQNPIAPEDIPIKIYYEDDDVMVVYKPPGMVVHPGIGNHSGTLVNAIAFHLKGKRLPVKDKIYLDRPGIVHRIDKDTSGLLIIGKTNRAIEHLGKQFYLHSVRREYYALVWGDVERDKGTITGHIGRHPKERIQFTVFPEGDVGKHAVTHYEVVERMYYVTLIKCHLETGRTHQIRVHMKHIGHTLFNDKRYGGDKILKGTPFTKYKQFVNNAFAVLPRHALHARSIGFIHPRTGKEIHIDSDLPDDFQQCLDKWRRYINSRKEILSKEE